MIRRIHVPHVRQGHIPLEPDQARHALSVLRLTAGTVVEVFDDAGQVARGILAHADGVSASVQIDSAPQAPSGGRQWTIASAVPKGERADWMIEKLSELGTMAFIPLAAARSVVLPEGKNKRQRWMRIAVESAKQSRRAGVMRIEELTPLSQVVQRIAPAASQIGWFLSTDSAAMPMSEAAQAHWTDPLILLVGPEGGWTAEEITLMRGSGLTPVGLGATILRVETAAIAAAAVVATLAPSRKQLSP